MKKVIVTTTINPVTEAIQKFQEFKDWDLIVIGDKKTPADYQLERGLYVTPEMQEQYDKDLSDAIGWNVIQRRNFGLLWAHDANADIIAVVDDDNIPTSDWGKNLLINKAVDVNFYETTLPAFDPIGATNHKNLWHRGYPLELIPERNYSTKRTLQMTFDIQADFWNGDPDIDAVCRMIYKPDCFFEEQYFPFSSNALSPFNSQNTFISKACLKDYFLFPAVGRMDDIWAAFYLQALGRTVVYGKPSVFQKRNVHNLIVDMKKEYLGYEFNLEIVKDLKKDADHIRKYLPASAQRAFEIYKGHFDE